MNFLLLLKIISLIEHLEDHTITLVPVQYYCTGKVWSFKNNNGNVEDFQHHTSEILASMDKKNFYLSSFGEGYNGELFLIDYNGSLYKIIPLKNN